MHTLLRQYHISTNIMMLHMHLLRDCLSVLCLLRNWRVWSDWMDRQADLSHWAMHWSSGRFYHMLVPIKHEPDSCKLLWRMRSVNSFSRTDQSLQYSELYGNNRTMGKQQSLWSTCTNGKLIRAFGDCKEHYIDFSVACYIFIECRSSPEADHVFCQPLAAIYVWLCLR